MSPPTIGRFSFSNRILRSINGLGYTRQLSCLIRASCLKKAARVVSPTGKQWTEANIGNALAGRDIARHLRELGENTRGPAPLSKQDRSRFLSALDTAVQAALREAARS
ncbi:MAG: DUF188 domain-containing protein [Stellaceae bacterium]